MQESLEIFMQQYGLAAVFLGTFLEGEVASLISGYFVFKGTLQYLPTAIAAFLGAWVADIVIFLVARNNLFARWGSYARMREKVRGARSKFQRGETVLMISYPFMAGTRAMVSFGLGASGSKLRKFLVLTSFPTLIWAFLWTGIGFLLGQSTQIFIDRFREFENLVIAVVFGVIVLFIMYRKWKNIRQREKMLIDQEEALGRTEQK